TNGGLWYSSAFARDAVRGRGKPIRLLADATHYDIDTTLQGSGLRGTTTISLTPIADGIRRQRDGRRAAQSTALKRRIDVVVRGIGQQADRLSASADRVARERARVPQAAVR